MQGKIGRGYQCTIDAPASISAITASGSACGSDGCVILCAVCICRVSGKQMASCLQPPGFLFDACLRLRLRHPLLT